MADINAKARKAAQKYVSLSRAGRSNKQFLRKKAQSQASRYGEEFGSSDPEYMRYIQQIAAHNMEATRAMENPGLGNLLQPPSRMKPASYSDWKASGRQHPQTRENVIPFGPNATLTRVTGAKPMVRNMGNVEVVTKGRTGVPQGVDRSYVPTGEISALGKGPTATGGPVRQYTNAEISRLNQSRFDSNLSSQRAPQRTMAEAEMGPVLQRHLHPRRQEMGPILQRHLHPRQQIQRPVQGPPRPRPSDRTPGPATFPMFRGKSNVPVDRIGRDFNNQPPRVQQKHAVEYTGRSDQTASTGIPLPNKQGILQQEYPIELYKPQNVFFDPSKVKPLPEYGPVMQRNLHPRRQEMGPILQRHLHPKQQPVPWFTKADRFARDAFGQSSARAKRIAEAAMGKAKTSSSAAAGAGKKAASKASGGLRGVQEWAAKPSSEIIEKYYKGKEGGQAIIDGYKQAENRLGKISVEKFYKMKPSELVKHFEKYDILEGKLSLEDAAALLQKPSSFVERGAVGAAKMAVRGAPRAAKWGAGLTAVGGTAKAGVDYLKSKDKEAKKKKDDKFGLDWAEYMDTIEDKPK